MELVAVYGTLKKASGNHAVMVRQGGIYTGRAITKDRYDMYDGVFPYVVKGSTCQIHVEVYAVHGFKHLDALEGHPHMYKRELVPILNYDKEAWMYIYQRPVTGTLLTGGVWSPPEHPF